MVCKDGGCHDSTRLGASTYIGKVGCYCGVGGVIVHGERVGVGSANEQPSAFVSVEGGWTTWRGPSQNFGRERKKISDVCFPFNKTRACEDVLTGFTVVKVRTYRCHRRYGARQIPM